MAIRVIEVPSSVRFDPPPRRFLKTDEEPTVPMSEASPEDVFTDAFEWNVAAAADYLGERGAQIIDWAWKQRVISLYGVPIGESEPVEIIFRREGGRIDFVASRVRLGMDVTHERLTIRWVDVKRLAQEDIKRLLASPPLPDESVKVDPTAAEALDTLTAELETRNSDLAAANARASEESAKMAQAIAAFEQLAHSLDDGKEEKDLLTERALEIAREAGKAVVLTLEQTAKEQAKSRYVTSQDDQLFRKFMEQFGDKKQARSQLYKHLLKIGCSEKTSHNRATAAKSRFKRK
jgi:hypothetical protein